LGVRFRVRVRVRVRARVGARVSFDKMNAYTTCSKMVNIIMPPNKLDTRKTNGLNSLLLVRTLKPDSLHTLLTSVRAPAQRVEMAERYWQSVRRGPPRASEL
jgi:hypothetical protein